MKRLSDIRTLLFFVVVGLLSLTPVLVGAQDVVTRVATMSNAEKKAKVAKDLERIKATLKFTKDRLEKARENKDIIQLNCVNDKLSGIKGFLKIAEQANRGLADALNKRDQDLIDHEFTKVAIATIRVENWRLEVEGCVGELSQYTGESDVSVQTDPDIRADDPVTSEFRPAFDALNITRPPAVTGSE